MHIVSVDDDQFVLTMIASLAQGLGYKVTSFISPLEALEYVKAHEFDILLTDYKMPDMNGVDFIENVRKINNEIPIVMISGFKAVADIRLNALKAGATDFLHKPIDESEFKVRLQNLALLCRSQTLLKERALLLEEDIATSVKLVESRELEALHVLGKVSEYRDKNTNAHVNRVASYSTMLIRELGANEQEQRAMFCSAPLHDIGKIGIPDDILRKPGSHNDEELLIMRRHPIIGYEMLCDAHSPYLKQGAEIALTHHEQYDGSGYPYGIKGDQIPLAGRILSIADVFDALTSVRPYKCQWSLEQAIQFLESEKGSRFDPHLVDIFVKNTKTISEILSSQSDMR